jgi:hypothetical protein
MTDKSGLDSLSIANTRSIQLAGVDDLEPHHLEQLRRSIAMLTPGRWPALTGIGPSRSSRSLQRLQRSDERYRQTVEQLRAILDRLKDEPGLVRAKNRQGDVGSTRPTCRAGASEPG